MKIRLSTTLSIATTIVTCFNLHSADPDLTNRQTAEIFERSSDTNRSADQPSPFLSKIPKRLSDSNIAQKKTRIIVITPTTTPRAPLLKAQSHDSLKHKELLAKLVQVPNEKQIPQIPTGKPALPETQISEASLDKALFFQVMDIVKRIVIEPNKQKVRAKMRQRVIVYKDYCTRYFGYTAWKELGTICVHVVEFTRGAPGEDENKYPFIAAFLHTAEASFLFDSKRLEIMYKGELIKLRDVFPNDIKKGVVFMLPYKEREYEDKYGNRRIENNGGVLDYEFKGKEYHSTPGSKWFF